jgi:hypothetical protein
MQVRGSLRVRNEFSFDHGNTWDLMPCSLIETAGTSGEW